MATTTANKGALRATATAKRDKAAQRTPLPPKNVAEIIADAQEAVAEAKAPRKRAPRKTATPAPEPAPEPAKKTKASRYAAELSALGWEPEITTTGTLVELVAKRGSEALYLAWNAEAHVSGTSTYTIQDRTVKVRNPAEAMRVAGNTPAEAEAVQAKVASNRQFRRKATGPTIRVIPFDRATATDAEIRAAIAEREITWHNSYAVQSEKAKVGTAKFIEIERRADGDVIIKFVDPENGFKAFRLRNLEHVGRRISVERIKQQIIASLAKELKKSPKTRELKQTAKAA